jgi:hypothetical protein|tara:strand:- start:2800 stop:3648 length:849 start_codon:yes stop_codon:yes gene_type:complete
MHAKLKGDWRKPTNTAAHQKGGIHDDDTATNLGFRGGTVAGSIHMEQFMPLLEATFGEDCWQTGTLSLYFRSATVDQEPVRCFISEPVTTGILQRAAVWMEKEDGTLVMSGTASCGGHDEESELRRKITTIRPVTEIRILSSLQVDDTTSPQPARIANSSINEQLQVITEPLDCYAKADRFGGRVLPMTRIVAIFAGAENALVKSIKPPFVGLYGAIEIEFIAGPVFSETDYMASGTIVGLSDSPQTEILWRDMLLAKGDKPIARMLKMDRLMKDSSPLWKA